jgi:pimeloyl-ACP methyl ester carboxylesterase
MNRLREVSRSITLCALVGLVALSAATAAAAQEPRDRYVNANGLRLHYLDWGQESAPPLVLIHHVNTNGHTWDRFARSMSDKYRVIAVDMRGHGDSGWSKEGKYTTEDYASDIAALVDSLKLSRVVVLGGSTGGRVALVYAALNPEEVAAVIMEDVGAVRPASIAQGFTDALQRGDPEFATVEEWTKQMQGQNKRTPPEFFAHLARHGTKPLPNGKLGLKRDPAILRDLRPLELWNYVEKVKVPFLLVLGSQSTIVGKDQIDKFRSILPTVQIVTVQNAGHIVVHDQPDVFERTIRDFLDRHGL